MNKRKEICDYLTKKEFEGKMGFVYLGSQNHHSLLRIKPWGDENVYIELDDDHGLSNKITVGVPGIRFDFNTSNMQFWDQERNVINNIYQNKTLELIAKRIGLKSIQYLSMINGYVPFVGLSIDAKGELTEKQTNLVDKVAKAAKSYYTVINDRNYKRELRELVKGIRKFISNGLDPIINHD